MNKLEFYFDYLSPYAYFAWKKLEKFCQEHNLELIVIPVAFGKLLDHWGQLGPAEIPPKREWLIKYCMYYASKNQIPLAFPKYHPFNSLMALRASLKSVSGNLQLQFVSGVFEHGWGGGEDISDVYVLSSIANKVGLSPKDTIEKVSSQEVKDELKNNTSLAISKGIFGIPSMVYEGQVYWGNDQFEYLADMVSGSFKVDQERFKELLNRPRGIDRSSFNR